MSAANFALPAPTDIPEGVDLAVILKDLADDGVSAPGKDVDALRKVVDRADQEGVKLSLVVLEQRSQKDSQLRDLATDVGKSEGGTVLVLSPSYAGTSSDSISRVKLEAGQDRTFTGDATSAANNFLDEITEPEPPWGVLTGTLLALVVIGAVFGRWWIRRNPYVPLAESATAVDWAERRSETVVGQPDAGSADPA